ncbi:MAG: DUF1194 domain-containing protein [Acetobacteraceae bacterium]
MGRTVWLLLCMMLAVAPVRIAAAEDVDVALVLVTDVSRSITDDEFKLEKEGYAAALTSEKVIAAIRGGALGAIAVAYVEFAASFEVTNVVDWTIIRDRATAEAFAARLHQAPRSHFGRTAIGAGIDRGVQLLAESGVNATRRVIDVCGDGTSNSGRGVNEARDEAVAQGIVINGLAIINENPVPWAQAHVQPPGGLPNYYRENVTGGPGSFVLEVRDFAKFGEAMTRKLVLEIAGRSMPRHFALGP